MAPGLAPWGVVADGGARYRSDVPAVRSRKPPKPSALDHPDLTEAGQGPSLSQAVPDVADLLAAAVSGIGGAERPGQVTMAEAVREAIETGD